MHQRTDLEQQRGAEGEEDEPQDADEGVADDERRQLPEPAHQASNYLRDRETGGGACYVYMHAIWLISGGSACGWMDRREWQRTCGVDGAEAERRPAELAALLFG